MTNFSIRHSALLKRLRRRRIGVLYGGWSAERGISLKSGRAVLGALRRLGFKPAAIDVTPDVARQLKRSRVNLAFVTLHGPFGEDGKIQGLLDILGIPYTGCGVLSSAMAMHKPTAKRVLKSAGLPVAEGFSFRRGEKVPRPSFHHAWVVKPASQGSAIGVSIVKSASGWGRAVRRAFASGNEIIVEKYVPGTEVTVGVLGNRALPVVEIVPRHVFYDFYSKYAQGGSRHIVPARLPPGKQREVSGLALRAFRALGCRHYARVDLMVPPKGRPVILEVNTLPGLTNVSLFPDAARAAGLSFDDLILEILALVEK